MGMRVAVRDRWWWPGFKSRARWFAIGAATAAVCLAIRSRVPEDYDAVRTVLGAVASLGGLLAAVQFTGDWPSRETRKNSHRPVPTAEQRAAAAPPRIYADFNNATPGGRLRLNIARSLPDLARFEPRHGSKVVFYDEEFEIEGVLERDDRYGDWLGRIDWNDPGFSRVS